MNRNNVPTGYDQQNLLQNNQSKFTTNVPPTSSNFGFVQNNNFPDVGNNNMTKSIGIPNNLPPNNPSNVSFNPNSVFNNRPNASTFTKNIISSPSPSFDSFNYSAPVQAQQEFKPIPVITKTRDKKKDPEFIMKLEKTKDFCKKATGELDYKRIKQAKDNIIEALKLIEELEKYDI